MLSFYLVLQKKKHTQEENYSARKTRAWPQSRVWTLIYLLIAFCQMDNIAKIAVTLFLHVPKPLFLIMRKAWQWNQWQIREVRQGWNPAAFRIWTSGICLYVVQYAWKSLFENSQIFFFFISLYLRCVYAYRGKKAKMKCLKKWEWKTEEKQKTKKLGENRGGKSREKEGELEEKLPNSVIKESTPSHPKVLYLVVLLI